MMNKIFTLCLVVIFNDMYASQGLLEALELASLLRSARQIEHNPELQKLLNIVPNKSGVVYIPSLRQGTIKGWPKGLKWENVAAGDGLNCGYHALKNIVFLMNALDQNNPNYLQDLNEKEPFFDCMRIWAPMIYRYRHNILPINNLQAQEIELLINNLNQLKKINTLSQLNCELDIKVIDQDIRLQRQAGFINEDLYRSMQTLSRKQDGIMGIVWNVGGGHWISFVIYKEQGVQKIFYMDSCDICNRDCRNAVAMFTAGVKDLEDIELSNLYQHIQANIDYMNRVVVLLQNPDLKEEILGTKDAKFIPADSIHAVFTKILIYMTDDVLRHESIQQQVMMVLRDILQYLNEHKDLMKQINWHVFGEQPKLIYFDGFDSVMTAILLRLTMISNEEKSRFWDEQVRPLL